MKKAFCVRSSTTKSLFSIDLNSLHQVETAAGSYSGEMLKHVQTIEQGKLQIQLNEIVLLTHVERVCLYVFCVYLVCSSVKEGIALSQVVSPKSGSSVDQIDLNR